MVYHEQQRLMRCAQHTLNGLLQEPAFDAAALTEIALSLDANKLSLAHRWPVLGNYDVNVLMLALQQRGYDVRWWDRRRSSAEQLRSAAESDTTLGLICNERRAILGVIPSRHWLAVRRVDGVWYDLDSRLPAPVALTPEGLLARLERLRRGGDGQVLVVEGAAGAAASAR